MQAFLEHITGYIVLVIQSVAVLVVLYGVARALFDIVGMLAHGRPSSQDERSVWLTFARWLTAGLTFQLAADVVQTTVAPTWNEIGRLAAIAGIRTALTFFLDRDIEAIRERQQRGQTA